MLLMLCTFGVAAMPLWPACREWRRPRDTAALEVDGHDVLQPALLAHAFVARLRHALATRQTSLVGWRLSQAPGGSDWPLTPIEQAGHRSTRVWYAGADMHLPFGLRLLAPAVAEGCMHTPISGVYRALWAGGRLKLGARSTVLSWAHGLYVDAFGECRFPGRVTAVRRITLVGPSTFSLLHAPVIEFRAPASAPHRRNASHRGPVAQGIPEAANWDTRTARGVVPGHLDVGANRCWQGDLVCRGELRLGGDCHVDGSLKAHGDLYIGPGCVVTGSVIGSRRVIVSDACSILGAVLADDAIALGSNCIIGAPGTASTVSAPRVRVAAGVVVHGTVWAGTKGRLVLDAGDGHAPELKQADGP